MKKLQFLDYIKRKFDFNDQELWDNCGIYNYDSEIDSEITGIYLTLDVSIKDINECIKQKCNILISHHPLYIGEISKVSKEQFKIIYNKIEKLKQNKITYICLHTCYDAYKEGTSYQLCKLITNNDKEIEIKKISNSKYTYYFELNNEIGLEFFLQNLSRKKIINTLITPREFLNKQVKTIALSSGSAIDEYYKLINSGIKIDCFLTGDVKWHNFVDAYEFDIPVIDIGHESEIVFVDYMYEVLELFGEENIIKSDNNIHVDYFK